METHTHSDPHYLGTHTHHTSRWLEATKSTRYKQRHGVDGVALLFAVSLPSRAPLLRRPATVASTRIHTTTCLQARHLHAPHRTAPDGTDTHTQYTRYFVHSTPSHSPCTPNPFFIRSTPATGQRPTGAVLLESASPTYPWKASLVTIVKHQFINHHSTCRLVTQLHLVVPPSLTFRIYVLLLPHP
jgi:hypothetical protein